MVLGPAPMPSCNEWGECVTILVNSILDLTWRCAENGASHFDLEKRFSQNVVLLRSRRPKNLGRRCLIGPPLL